MSLRLDIKLRAVSEGSDLQDADVEGVDVHPVKDLPSPSSAPLAPSQGAESQEAVEGPRECASEETLNSLDAPLLPHQLPLVLARARPVVTAFASPPPRTRLLLQTQPDPQVGSWGVLTQLLAQCCGPAVPQRTPAQSKHPPGVSARLWLAWHRLLIALGHQQPLPHALAQEQGTP